jgi:hypothetical protein
MLIVLLALLSFLPIHPKSPIKYVAWVYEDQQYKNAQLSRLSHTHIQSFKKLFHQNKTMALHILTKKYYNILDLDIDLCDFNDSILNKINLLLRKYGSNIVQSVFGRINRECFGNITVHNILLIYKFICEEKFFIEEKKEIMWGPGNHKIIDANIEAHYIKHVKTYPESLHWNNINLDDYKNYAINSFYKMRNVVVHSNGKHVYLSGFYDNVFIIARYGDDSVLGISSCYYVESGVKPGRMMDKCFEIIF